MPKIIADGLQDGSSHSEMVTYDFFSVLQVKNWTKLRSLIEDVFTEI